ncbi:UDP-N-acetylglucosamine 2-epimerase (non-hydrolyzing) [Thalassospira xiamenensis]|nr:UDP-N-acetylglucosamine 2-epimerase (non-hydrolyzing) [Thalassospira xiamenensis]
MRVLTIIGARPQFIKASVVSRAIKSRQGLEEIIIHTGQHFDSNMSDIFFCQLGIPKPQYQLDIHGSSHAVMTGRMMEKLENVMLNEAPDRVLVYGDTNSTLAGALVAAKLHIPVAHVEAGLRSFNMKMPEEVNRILTDQVSDILFCPTDAAVANLEKEGFYDKPAQVLKVGDVMQDSALLFAQHAQTPQGLGSKAEFVLATLHRAENTDDPRRLASIVSALNELHQTVAEVILPLHPRTKAAIERNKLSLDVTIIDPVGYFEMVWLLNRCDLVLTDSGGVQKEAFFFGKPCITMRDQTEWVELVDIGANVLAGADKKRIIEFSQINIGRTVKDELKIYGGGDASQRIASFLSASGTGNDR